MHYPVNEPIDALVIYRCGALHPLIQAFRWRSRRYDVTAIHLVHREREGERVFLLYSVGCRGDTYLLRLDTQRGQWTLEALDTEC